MGLLSPELKDALEMDKWKKPTNGRNKRKRCPNALTQTTNQLFITAELAMMKRKETYEQNYFNIGSVDCH